MCHTARCTLQLYGVTLPSQRPPVLGGRTLPPLKPRGGGQGLPCCPEPLACPTFQAPSAGSILYMVKWQSSRQR